MADTAYHELAKEYIGRWAGDRIAIIGDYAESDDIPGEDADLIYTLCGSEKDKARAVAQCREYAEKETSAHHQDKADRIEAEKCYTDITEYLIPLVERNCWVKISGSGWRDKKRQDDRPARVGLAPDMVISKE